MGIVVDTSVWSLVLRRGQVDENHFYVRAFREAAEQGEVFLLGPVLQELLDGVKQASHFEKLLRILEPFPIISPERKTYIEASRLRNLCRSKGIQASPVDFFIAASCIENQHSLLTTDQDFERIARHSKLELVIPPSRPV